MLGGLKETHIVMFLRSSRSSVHGLWGTPPSQVCFPRSAFSPISLALIVSCLIPIQLLQSPRLVTSWWTYLLGVGFNLGQNLPVFVFPALISLSGVALHYLSVPFPLTIWWNNLKYMSLSQDQLYFPLWEI